MRLRHGRLGQVPSRAHGFYISAVPCDNPVSAPPEGLAAPDGRRETRVPGSAAGKEVNE